MKDLLWLFLFITVFVNGFEAGGYQACLYEIGRTYDLSVTHMGLFASAELLATMLAPIALGSWADRTDKKKSILLLLVIQAVVSISIFLGKNETVFIAGIFFLGLTTSALQFISIAALADHYPLSGKKKIGYITSMYALGALTAPLVISFFLNRGVSWRILFCMIATGTVIAAAGVFAFRKSKPEQREEETEENADPARFILAGVLLLCVVMFIYVGFENGFAFFVDTLFNDVFHSSLGKFALSLFWAVMIPSRILVGYFSKYAGKILLLSVVTIPIVTLLLAFAPNGYLVMALCIPLSLACGAIYPCVLTTVLKFAGGNRTATATAMITVSTGLGGVVFTALTGIMADRLGIRTAICLLSAFFILSVISVILVSRGRFSDQSFQRSKTE